MRCLAKPGSGGSGVTRCKTSVSQRHPRSGEDGRRACNLYDTSCIGSDSFRNSPGDIPPPGKM